MCRQSRYPLSLDVIWTPIPKNSSPSLIFLSTKIFQTQPTASIAGPKINSPGSRVSKERASNCRSAFCWGATVGTEIQLFGYCIMLDCWLACKWPPFPTNNRGISKFWRTLRKCLIPDSLGLITAVVKSIRSSTFPCKRTNSLLSLTAPAILHFSQATNPLGASFNSKVDGIQKFRKDRPFSSSLFLSVRSLTRFFSWGRRDWTRSVFSISVRESKTGYLSFLSWNIPSARKFLVCHSKLFSRLQ